MRLATIIFVMVSVLTIVCSSESHAQLFGERTLGQPLTKQPKPTAQTSSDGGAAISDNARFLRENRDARAFVGADSEEGGGFVGLSQGATDGNVRSAIRDLRAEQSRAAQINRPLRQPNVNEMYLPRVTLGFSVPKPDPALKEAYIREMLASTTPIESVAPSIDLSYSEGTVTLRGQVQNAEQRDLIARMLMFEPGVDAVRNELEVSPGLNR